VVDVNTTVFNKQLEELESLADSTGLYDDQQDDDEEEVQAEPSMEWRRAALEEGYSRVKRAKGRPVDPNKVYEIGTLLFEPAEGKFGRVKRSVPGYLCIHFLRGGEREYGRRPDVEQYLRENHRGKSAAELATQLGLTETEVQGHLNRLGLVRVDSIPGMENPNEDHKDKSHKKPTTKAGKDVIPGMEEDFGGRKSSTPKSAGGKSKLPAPADALGSLPPRGKDIKSSIPQKAGGKTQVPAGKSAVPQKAASGKTLVPAAKGKTVPPPSKTQVPHKAAGKSALPAPAKGKGPMAPDEANTYIKKHFQQQSNKDLADKTGLSEHTIRRKLGEWGLRRAKD
jgi:DNA-binding CsgD family transcriptional regulator